MNLDETLEQPHALKDVPAETIASGPVEVSMAAMPKDEPALPVIAPMRGIPECEDIDVVATVPEEMRQSQTALVSWAGKKVATVLAEAKELQAAYAHAVKSKWKSETLKKHAGLAMKRHDYYAKIHAALRAGYCIVPNFPVTLFAIRTDKNKPVRMATDKAWLETFIQQGKQLPMGVGDYQNPNPLIYEGGNYVVTLENGSKQDRRQAYAKAWDDLEFPAHMCKLQIMEVTTKAMEMKIFDQLGMLPADRERHPDPLIVGRILYAEPGHVRRKTVTFIIGWRLETKDL